MFDEEPKTTRYLILLCRNLDFLTSLISLSLSLYSERATKSIRSDEEPRILWTTFYQYASFWSINEAVSRLYLNPPKRPLINILLLSLLTRLDAF